MTAPRELVIEVTAEDIAGGIPGNVCLCPIAIAACRALGDSEYWMLKVEEDRGDILQVSLYYASDSPAPDVIYLLPDEAAAFVRRFDYDEQVEPLTFTAAIWDGTS